MKLLLISVLGIIFSTVIVAQENELKNSRINDYDLQKLIKEEKLVINEELVLNVLEYKKDEQYISFTEIYYSLKGRERTEFVREYLKADLNIESLENIRKKVIEDNGGEYTEIAKITDEDIDWFMQVKAEMTNKLNNIELTDK